MDGIDGDVFQRIFHKTFRKTNSGWVT